jgi:cell wall assembly regulator SMI1
MSIKMEGAHAVTEAEIASFEQVAGMRLPDQYRAFLLQHNGAKPETNIFSTPDGNESGVNEFIPMGELLSASQHIDGVIGRFLAVARDDCGNYVCLDLDSEGEVFFWDHEQPDKLRLAKSWNEFLQMLRPFDVSKVELRPEQVIKAWIDPEFLKRLRKE